MREITLNGQVGAVSRRRWGSVAAFMGMASVTWLIFSGTPVLAQENEVAIEVPAREAAAKAEAERAAAAARARQALEPQESVTLADVFADPDNLDLNFRYAKAQIARGELLGAASTLERVLLVDPNLTRASLLYGVVLFRLDNLEEAERTLKAVRELRLLGPVAPCSSPSASDSP